MQECSKACWQKTCCNPALLSKICVSKHATRSACLQQQICDDDCHRLCHFCYTPGGIAKMGLLTRLKLVCKHSMTCMLCPSRVIPREWRCGRPHPSCRTHQWHRCPCQPEPEHHPQGPAYALLLTCMIMLKHMQSLLTEGTPQCLLPAAVTGIRTCVAAQDTHLAC